MASSLFPLFRPVLHNRTNNPKEITAQELPEQLLALDLERKRHAQPDESPGSRKRVRISDSDEEDGENEAAICVKKDLRRVQNRTMFRLMDFGMSSGRYSISHTQECSWPIIRSLVSSNITDSFKCHSAYGDTFLSPPYACAYSHSAKRGVNSLLAVSTEQGDTHVLDTSQRCEWDVEPQRITLHSHRNGIFDVQWSPDDALLATASADKTIALTQILPSGPEPSGSLHSHHSTIKCISWDQRRNGDILCSGSRDGMICVWDLRVGNHSNEAGSSQPVLTIHKAHEATGSGKTRKSKLGAASIRSVTSLLFPETDSYGIVSGGSNDGILKHWDLRRVNVQSQSKSSPHPSLTTPLHTSSADPTTYGNTRRVRSISSLVAGTGATSGLLFALSTGSQIHTYSLSTLEPLSGWTPEPMTDSWMLSHESMRTDSFYVRISLSPCGRWLVCGGKHAGSAFVFDVAQTARYGWRRASKDKKQKSVQLHGQNGEVGAVDWAEGMLATCADEGTVRVWRPNMDVYRRWEREPEEVKWDWACARS